MEEYIKQKIIGSLDELGVLCDNFRSKGLRIACTSGAFDVLHDGHLRYLARVRGHGDVLIVGVDNNVLVKKFKGEDRPHNTEETRVFLVAGFMCVDRAIIIQDSSELILAVKPDVFVMSRSTNIKFEGRDAEKKLIKKLGGVFVELDPTSKNSTTKLLKKIKG